MKKKYINQLKTGEIVDDLFLLAQKALAQKRDGNHYLKVSLSDRTGELKGVAWDNIEHLKDAVSVGDFVWIKGTVNEYNGIQQIVIKTMQIQATGSVEPSDFLPITGRDIKKMMERLIDIIDTIKADYYKTLLNLFFNDESFIEKFKNAPAAKKMHHAYIGGLLEHTLSLALLADRVADHYTGIDRDLLIIGAILHDIGKVREFDYEYFIDYSDEGRLISHIVIGLQMIDERILMVQDFPARAAMLLRHMIISHHGSRELGSPEPPKTLEAVLLNYLDEIDSKIHGIRDFMESQDSDDNWTGYHKLLERFFYKGRR